MKGKTPKPLGLLGGTVPPHPQAVAEELEAQSGRAACPESHSKAGRWRPCLTSEPPAP